MAKILAAILVLLMAGGGGAAGLLLRPTPEPDADAVPVPPPQNLDAAARLREPFVIPVIRNGRIWSHVVLTLGVSADETEGATILQRDPILRDGLTEALFLHASLGGFDGDFTAPASMHRLRERLDAVVRARLDDETAAVLIVSMSRQSG
ncbi:hypothetical protein [Jannaschia marina]|uniref:hypothetical protein n=1 Tax=Jannaschia marina TaxID=2741674 RepID=UPI0015CBC027|nr:hypothetical protein [Jannaschia marina]